MSNPVFKQDNQGEILLFPSRLDENIPVNHLVRIVNRVVDSLDLCDILGGYRGGGTSAYHPRMLLKVLLYSYSLKIYSGRKIASALESDIRFMWLSGKQTPDFRTINRFRSSRLKESIDEIFKSLLLFMFEEGYIRFEEYYCDGTTLLADANKHKVTWKKNLERYRSNVEERIDQTLKEIDTLVKEEDSLCEPGDAYLVAGEDPSREERIVEASGKLNKILQQKKGKDKERKKKARKLDGSLREDLVRVEVYKEKEGLCGLRSGYSSTDCDASPMRIKECRDELRPAYNVLTGSENQYITGVSVHQNPNDGSCFASHMDDSLSLKPAGKQEPPGVVIADAGFGTEENYEYLEKKEPQGKEVEALLKYPSYDKGKQASSLNDPFRKENMPYDEKTDSYVCPASRRLIYKETIIRTGKNDFKSTLRVYECEDCRGCSFFSRCGGKRKAGSRRQIQVNKNLDRHREKARRLLDSPRGKEKMKQRGHDIETCFGDIKHNQSFRRFHLRGLEKVKIEVVIVAMSHNVRKMHLETLGKAG